MGWNQIISSFQCMSFLQNYHHKCEAKLLKFRRVCDECTFLVGGVKTSFWKGLNMIMIHLFLWCLRRTFMANLVFMWSNSESMPLVRKCIHWPKNFDWTKDLPSDLEHHRPIPSVHWDLFNVIFFTLCHSKSQANHYLGDFFLTCSKHLQKVQCMYGVFTYIWLLFCVIGKCRSIYHTLMLWERETIRNDHFFEIRSCYILRRKSNKL